MESALVLRRASGREHFSAIGLPLLTGRRLSKADFISVSLALEQGSHRHLKAGQQLGRGGLAVGAAEEQLIASVFQR